METIQFKFRIAVPFLVATTVLSNNTISSERVVTHLRSYRIVNASQGGWPLSLTSGPFVHDEDVSCHKDMNRCVFSGEGVDAWFSDQHVSCSVDTMVNATHVKVVCIDDEEYAMPMECCERFAEDDSTVYSTPLGYFHYSSYRQDPRTMVMAMDVMERSYLEQLKASKGSEPMFVSFYGHDEWNHDENKYDVIFNVPLRVRKSSRYPDPYRCLLQDKVDVMDEKGSIAVIAQRLGLNRIGGPFPVTYFSCKEALEATEDPTTKFFIKPVVEVLGRGIQVKYRSELAELWDSDKCTFGDEENEIIQEAVTDLALISGSRFDARTFLLVHNGRLFMHNNCFLSFTPDAEYNATCAEQAFNFSQKHSQEDQKLVYAFYNHKSAGKPKQWLDATYKNLVKALPIMKQGIDFTTEENNDKLFHIFAVDVMIRENGEAIFSEINGWPNTEWMRGHRAVAHLDENGQETGERSIKDGSIAYENSMKTMLADFFAIVLGLADTVPTDDMQSRPFILEGRVREVLPESLRAIRDRKLEGEVAQCTSRTS